MLNNFTHHELAKPKKYFTWILQKRMSRSRLANRVCAGSNVFPKWLWPFSILDFTKIFNTTFEKVDFTWFFRDNLSKRWSTNNYNSVCIVTTICIIPTKSTIKYFDLNHERWMISINNSVYKISKTMKILFIWKHHEFCF